MRGVRPSAFVILGMIATATPAWPQTPPGGEPPRKRMSYVEAKPQIQMELLQKLLRRMPGGEATIVKLAEPNNPMPAHYSYSGPGFKGDYWEERLGERDPISILGVWLSGFHNHCNGRYLITGEAPVENDGNVVHSGAWSCERKDFTINGYFTVQKYDSIVHIFFTLPDAINPKAARNMAEQIHATLVEITTRPSSR